VRGSLIGLVIGAALGAGAMYLALRPPWGHRAAVPADAPAIASAPSDAGTKKPGKKRGVRRRPSGDGRVVSGDDPSWTTDDGPGEEAPVKLIPLTAGDRALEWRGDETTKPAQKIDMSSGAEARSLDDAEIQSTIASQSGATQSCVMQAATDTDLKGTITVRMIVDGSGRVTKSKLQAPRYMLEHGLLGCVQRAVKAMKFPATGMATLVTMPINFS
jgi:hypothetical protein